MNDLKLFSNYYVTCSDLTEFDTNVLMNFVGEATDQQLEHLLTTGKMLNEEEILNEINFISLLLKSSSAHIDAISAFGFGNWLKTLPKALDMAAQAGGMMGGSAGSIKAVAAVGLPPAAAAALIIWLSFKVTKHFLKKKSSELCGKYKGDAKKKCMEHLKAHARKMRANDLRKAMAACSKSRSPEKCKSKIAKKIRAIQGGSNEK